MGNYRDVRMMQDAIATFGAGIERRRRERARDRYANDIMNEIDPPRAGTADGRIPTEQPHSGGYAEYQLLADARQREMDNAIRRWRMQREIAAAENGGSFGRRTSRSGVPLVDTPYGQMTAKEWAQEERVRSGIGRTPRAPRKERDPFEDIERDLEKHLMQKGLTLNDVPRLRNQRLVDETGKQVKDDEADYFEADLDGSPVRVPRADYDELRRSYDSYDSLRKRRSEGGMAPDATSSGPGTVTSRGAVGAGVEWSNNVTQPRANAERQLTPSSIPADAIVANSREEAAKLPSGTVFYTPDGRRKVRP